MRCISSFQGCGSALYEDTKSGVTKHSKVPSGKLDILSVQQQAGLRGTSVPRVLLNKSILYKLAAYYNNCLLQGVK